MQAPVSGNRFLLPAALASWRLVLKRSRAEWLIVAAAWLVVVAAATLLAAGAIYADAVGRAGLQRTLEAAPATDSGVRVVSRAEPGEVTVVRPLADEEIARALRTVGGEAYGFVRSESFTLPGAGDDQTPDLTVLESAEGLDRHAELLAGSWPAAGSEPIQAAVTRSLADQLGLEVGERLEVATRRAPVSRVTVEVTGVLRPVDRGAAYWWNDELQLDGRVDGRTFTTFGPFFVDATDLLERATTRRVDLEWRAFPAFGELEVDEAVGLRRAVANLESRLGRALPVSYADVETDLPSILEGADRSLLVARTGVLLLLVQLAMLAGYAVVLVAALLIDQRRVHTALLRSRGASALHIGVFGFMEGVLLVAPAALAGPFLARAALGVFERVGPLSGIGLTLDARITNLAVTLALVAAIGCLVLLVVPSLVSARALAAVRGAVGRPSQRTVMQRLGIDVALLSLAGLGLWELQLYGAPLTRDVRGTLGFDPLLIAAPAIGLLAGAVLALRIVPLGAQLLESVIARAPGLAAALGARQLSRRPLRYTRSALLLMLAVSLGIFAAGYGTTWAQSQRDQAAFAAAADLRVSPFAHADLPASGLGAGYRELAGVRSASPVVEERFEAEDESQGRLLGIDPAATEAIHLRPDLAPSSFADLTAVLRAARPTPPVLVLPGEPQRLRVGVARALEDVVNDEFQASLPSGWRGIQVGVVVRDADGLLHRFVAEDRLTTDAGEAAAIVPLAPELPDGGEALPSYPLELVAVELNLRLPTGVTAVGEVGVTAVDVSQQANGEAWEDLAPGPAVDSWDYLRGDAATPPVPIPDALQEATSLLFDTPGQLVGTDEQRFTLRPLDLAGDDPLPAVVTDQLSQLTGADVGDRISVGVLGDRRDVEIIGRLTAFPSVPPDTAAVLVDGPSLALAEFDASGQTLFADEWWLSVDDEAADDLAARLREAPFSSDEVVSRVAETRRLLTDPIALGIIGALALGAAAAALFAMVGFVVSAVVATRERLAEFALLRALGLSPAQLTTWLTLESAFLLLVGLAAGIGVGMLISWIVLPTVTLTEQGTAVVPPVQMRFPWEAAAIVALAGVAVLLVTVAVLAQVLRRVGLAGVLRAGEQ